jgi:fumarate reductase flavoprotein subunit
LQTLALLEKEGKKLGVDYRMETRGIEILMENGAVSGVKVSTSDGEYNITAKSVVLATGGYQYSDELITRYIPQWNGYPRACSPALTGDGHLMAERIGAVFTDMEVTKGNTTIFMDGKTGVPLSNIPGSAILVNTEGWRFVSESNGYLAGIIMREQTDGVAYHIFGQSAVDKLDTPPGFMKYAISAPTLEALADKVGIYGPQLALTVGRYLELVANGADVDYGRTGMINCLENETAYYAIKVTAALQGTFGGIRTNTKTNVINGEGAIIPGLFAAGECVGEGLRGLNPMTENMVFGSIAGTNAAKHALDY